MASKKPLALAADGRPELLQSGDGLDSTTRWADSADPTKQIVFDISILATGALRTFTWPNKNGTIATLTDTQGVVIQEFFTDVGNVGGGEDDLYSTTLAASILNADGEMIKAVYAGLLNVSACTLRVRWAGTSIFDSSTITTSGTPSFEVRAAVMRSSSTTARASVTCLVNGVGVLTKYTLLSSQDFTITNILKLTGQGGMVPANNDVVAKFGYVEKTGSA